ncbi:uncharacterized protein E6C27_scaffold468G00280 [Cucumis melo var. makuwa]|uniref:Ty3-gypsy retrotransposon protein n=1 Tax=Cucumis melo var. makuwa TaxID=1194695 RepID=A0A5A7V6S4_CUCMM|nr:uncharacterized protein E6C27_scaffold468G00280 [Cucumis melo var. makuwa]
MKLSIASRVTNDFSVPEVRKDKKETKDVEKIVKSTAKESIVVNTTPLKFSKRKEERTKKKDDGSERRRPTLKEKTLHPRILKDENPKAIAWHAVNATNEENIPPRSLEEEKLSKDQLRFNVDDLLSLPQETKTILMDALLNSGASSSSVPTVTYEKQRVDQILIDNGSTVNIMPNQRAIDMIRLELTIGGLKASALFLVIDSRTTYKLLLGRPWIHGNGVVTSTLHQGFKFYQDGVKKVEANFNPFLEAKSHFINAKFYLKNDDISEVVPAKIPLIKREDNLQLKSLAPQKSVILMDEKTSKPLILCYVPLSRRKKGESPFVESPKGLKVGDIEILKESFSTLLTKITKQEIKIDLTKANLPQRQTKDGFNPKAYKLMAKAGYDFTTHTSSKA